METMLLVSLLINKKLPMSSKFFNYAILLNLPASKKLWRYNFWLRCHQLFFVFLRLKLVSLMSQAFGQSFAYVGYLHLCHKKYNNHYFENIWSEKKKTYIHFWWWWWWREGWWWERPDCYILKSDKLISFKIWLVQQAMYLFWGVDDFGSPTLIGLKKKSGVNGILLEYDHCVKSVCIRNNSGPYFLTFRLNTERYFVFCCIQSKCRKIQTRITLNTETFYAVDDIVLLNVWIKWEVIAKEKKNTVISSYVICQKKKKKKWDHLLPKLASKISF